MSNVVYKNYYALLTGCILVVAAITSTAARAGEDGVVFDSTNTDNGSATGNSSFAISNSFNSPARAMADESMAVGNYATASSRGGIAIGSVTQAGTTVPVIAPPIFDGNTQTPTDANIAIGFNAISSGNNAVAVGGANGAFGARALGDNSAAYGTGSVATGTGSIAVGKSSVAGEIGTVAIGLAAHATAATSVALGRQAVASESDSVAIGHGSIADQPNTVSVGSLGSERRLSRVADATRPTDAVNLRQVNALIAAAVPMSRYAAIGAGPRGGKGPSKRAGRSDSTSNQALLYSPQNGSAIDRPEHRQNGVAEPVPLGHAAASVTSFTCDVGATTVTVAAGEDRTSSSQFALVPRSGVSFRQGDSKNGCVILSFSAEVAAWGNSLMEIRPVLDGNFESSPAAVYFAQSNEGVHSRAFNFALANVAPGPHRLELHFRNVGGDGVVSLGYRTTSVQFAR